MERAVRPESCGWTRQVIKSGGRHAEKKPGVLRHVWPVLIPPLFSADGPLKASMDPGRRHLTAEACTCSDAVCAPCRFEVIGPKQGETGKLCSLQLPHNPGLGSGPVSNGSATPEFSMAIVKAILFKYVPSSDGVPVSAGTDVIIGQYEAA